MKGTLGAPRAKARADIVLLSEAAAVPSGGVTPTQRRALHTDDEEAIGPGDVDLAKEEAPPWPAATSPLKASGEGGLMQSSLKTPGRKKGVGSVRLLAARRDSGRGTAPAQEDSPRSSSSPEFDASKCLEDHGWEQQMRRLGNMHLAEDEAKQKPSEDFPVVLDVFPGFSWTYTVNGLAWNVADLKDKAMLWHKLPQLLLPGVPVTFTHLKTGRVIADGRIEKLHVTHGGTLQIKMNNMYSSFSLLANTRVSIREMPLHLQEEMEHRARFDEGRHQEFQRGQALDPFPKVGHDDLEYLLLNHGKSRNGDFLLHSRHEASQNKHDGFRRLWVSYRTSGKQGIPTIESFHVHLIEPSLQHPLWIEWVGHFTTLDSPWKIKNPQNVGLGDSRQSLLQEGKNVFSTVDKLRTYHGALRRRISPYAFDTIKEDKTGGRVSVETGSSSSSTGLDEDYSNEEVQAENDDDDKGSHYTKTGGTACLCIILAGIFAVGLWLGLSGVIGDKSSSHNAPTPPPVPLPVGDVGQQDLGPYLKMNVLLQGIKLVWFEAKVQTAYKRAIQRMPPLSPLNAVKIDIRESRRRTADYSEDPDRRAAVPKLLIVTTVYVRSLDVARELAGNLSTPQGLAQQWPNFTSVLTADVLSSIDAKLKTANMTVQISVSDVVYAAGSKASDTTAVIVESTPIQTGGIACPKYVAPNNYTSISSAATTLLVGMTSKISCAVPWARLVGNVTEGYSDILSCQNVGGVGTYNKVRYCKPCSPGFFPGGDDGWGGQNCVACPAGSARSAYQSACTLCPVNTYAENPGMGACSTCRQNTVTSGKTGSKSASTCLCQEGYYHATGVNMASKLTLTPCAACPIGKYSNQAGLTACTQCTNFSNTSSQGSYRAQDCLCKPGFYATSHGTSSQTSTSSSGAGTCKPCETGTYKGKQGNEACTSCSTGDYENKTTTLAMGSTFFSDCKCVGGYHMTSSKCNPCDAGKYKPGISGVCMPCVWGEFSHEGQTTCSTCDHGKYSLNASSKCLLCSSGKYAVSPSSSCSHCPQGSFSPTPGSSCNQCSPGSEPNADSTTCTPCGPGMYNDEPNGVCRQCTAGKKSRAYYRSTGCDDCLPGKYTAAKQKATCDLCVAGKFSLVSNSSCDSCIVGKYSLAQASVCISCPVGTYANAIMTSSCVKCAVGKYMEYTGSTLCYGCPKLSNTTVFGTGNKVCEGYGFSEGECLASTNGFNGYVSSFTSSDNCSALNCSCTSGGVAQTHSPSGKSCGCTCHANWTRCCAYSPSRMQGSAYVAAECTSNIGNSSCASPFARDGADSYLKCSCSSGKSMSSDRLCLDYWKAGVQHNVPESDLISGGWTKCEKEFGYDETMSRKDLYCDDLTATRFAFAVREGSSSTLAILAMGSAASSNPKWPVFPLPLKGARLASDNGKYDDAGNLQSGDFVENQLQEIAQLENGVYWYLSDSTFGFSTSSLVAIAATKVDMETVQCEDRVGWALGEPGYRVGCTLDVKNSNWKRVIFKM